MTSEVHKSLIIERSEREGDLFDSAGRRINEVSDPIPVTQCSLEGELPFVRKNLNLCFSPPVIGPRPFRCRNFHLWGRLDRSDQKASRRPLDLLRIFFGSFAPVDLPSLRRSIERLFRGRTESVRMLKVLATDIFIAFMCFNCFNILAWPLCNSEIS